MRYLSVKLSCLASTRSTSHQVIIIDDCVFFCTRCNQVNCGHDAWLLHFLFPGSSFGKASITQSIILAQFSVSIAFFSGFWSLDKIPQGLLDLTGLLQAACHVQLLK